MAGIGGRGAGRPSRGARISVSAHPSCARTRAGTPFREGKGAFPPPPPKEKKKWPICRRQKAPEKRGQCFLSERGGAVPSPSDEGGICTYFHLLRETTLERDRPCPSKRGLQFTSAGVPPRPP